MSVRLHKLPLSNFTLSHENDVYGESMKSEGLSSAQLEKRKVKQRWDEEFRNNAKLSKQKLRDNAKRFLGTKPH